MTTPARRQYLRIKGEHPDEVLLFRIGDFYETFDDDARLVARELEIALTSREMGRGQRVPLAGIPYHALEPYLARLVKKGYRVAICEQTSDPAESKGLVDRAVVRVVTPGTVIEDSILEQKSNNYLAAVAIDGDQAGLAYVDITTSEFLTTQIDLQRLSMELSRLAPAEVLVSEADDGVPSPEGAMITPLPPDSFHREWARETLLDHFAVASLEAFGCEHLPLASQSAGAIVDYLRRNQKSALTQITSLRTYSTESYMVLDPQTRRNLDLFAGGRWASSGSSLLTVLDRTKTPMGGRLLRKWLGQPLLSVEQLTERQDAVAWFRRSDLRRERVLVHLEAISDIERLINRIRGLNAAPRDLVGLAQSLEAAPQVKGILQEDDDSAQVASIASEIWDNQEVVQLVRSAIANNPPISVGSGQVIKEGFSSELDELRLSARDAQGYIAGLEQSERERTGIKSLKVGYNKVFGYYIEVTKTNVAQVPEDYMRRQTLVGAERYITPDMKEHESLILNAQERIDEIEGSLFRRVCGQVGESSSAIMTTARAIARTDVFCSLGDVASRNGYVRPELNDGKAIDIRQGRHPVVEQMLPSGAFVPNDTRLSSLEEQLIVLTGPNMAGKSTYIRQVALIVLMAQIGSFVPAEEATIGVVDRIFTRIGLQDDLAVGQSTFMVEMVETASILNHATERSLIILDEIGRGTSTYDGLAIARATAEYIHSHPRLGCKTLFATHYHELTGLADYLPRTRNYNVAVSEDQGNVVFLRRIVAGGADKSYGVHVARLAGLPGSVINRAWEVLGELEKAAADHGRSDRPLRRQGHIPLEQLPLLGRTPEVVEDLLKLDISSMTPLEAINKLYELQERSRDS
ncbi:MAG: DNA mismatch repair protein MutS [Chloroflexi bacterium]|nr:DNA mismatch repair protein MutS [Chloroflexota bacterium]